MKIIGLYVFCVLSIFLVKSGEALRCRSGNQSSNEHVQKIMQSCRKKHGSGGGKNSNDYTTTSENDSSDDDSASSMSLDEELFFGNSNRKTNGNDSSMIRSSNTRQDGNRANPQIRKQNSYVYRQKPNIVNYSWTNDGDRGTSGNENRNHRDSRNSVECITHCFFEELNLVDQRGFPERGSVIEIMTRGIQDPVLHDFIEESIFECFHYLEAATNNRDKCTFSTNLITCFADKGRDRCEDWDEK